MRVPRSMFRIQRSMFRDPNLNCPPAGSARAHQHPLTRSPARRRLQEGRETRPTSWGRRHSHYCKLSHLAGPVNCRPQSRSRPQSRVACRPQNRGRRCRCGRGRVMIVAFGVADTPHSGVRSRRSHCGSSWGHTGSRDRPAGRSRNRPRNKSGDGSGGVLRDGKMTAVAQ